MAKDHNPDPRKTSDQSFPRQQQQPPGSEAAMKPRPDHGEKSYRRHGRLKDRVAIVTGGDSGIGRAVALAFAREGAHVAISYLNEHEDAEESKRLVESAGRSALLLAGDIADDAQCARVVQSFGEEKVEKHGQDAPLQRGGQPAEVAPLYVFLASDESRYVSGEIMGVTGGSPLD